MIIQYFLNGNILPLLFFAFVLVFFIWYAFAIIYHLIRFGIGVTPKIIALIFLAGSLALFNAVMISYTRVNWGELIRFIVNGLTITLPMY